MELILPVLLLLRLHHMSLIWYSSRRKADPLELFLLCFLFHFILFFFYTHPPIIPLKESERGWRGGGIKKKKEKLILSRWKRGNGRQSGKSCNQLAALGCWPLFSDCCFDYSIGSHLMETPGAHWKSLCYPHECLLSGYTHIHIYKRTRKLSFW